MNFDSSIPIYLQVMDQLRKEIMTGRIAPGEKLPGSRDLAIRFTINPNTASKVYQELEKAQLCFTRRGLGTFVTEDTARIAALKTEIGDSLTGKYLEEMHQFGFSDEEIAQTLERMK